MTYRRYLRDRVAVGSVLYRAWVDQTSLRYVLKIDEYVVFRITPKGFWVRERFGNSGDWKKWCSFTTRYCTFDRHAAVVDLAYRSRSWMSHIRSRQTKAQVAINLAQQALEILMQQPNADVNAVYVHRGRLYADMFSELTSDLGSVTLGVDSEEPDPAPPIPEVPDVPRFE